MTAINEMFTNDNGTATTGTRALNGTAQLTNLSMSIGNTLMTKINEKLSDDDQEVVALYKQMLADSKTDHHSMDYLIAFTNVLEDADVEFIKDLDEATIEGMLKSQQSKRSRAKGKIMTRDNYMAMLTGAIAENLIRLATGKEKMASRRTASIVEFNDEALQRLAADQDDLRRELRNIQSKKSIMKSKDGFSEESDGWKSLLAAEAALKAIRIEGAGGKTTKIVEVDRTRDALLVVLTEDGQLPVETLDPDKFTKKQLVALVEQIKALVTEPDASIDPTDDNNA